MNQTGDALSVLAKIYLQHSHCFSMTQGGDSMQFQQFRKRALEIILQFLQYIEKL